MGTQMNDGYMLFLSVPGSMHSPASSSFDTASPPACETVRDNWPTRDWTGPVIEVFPDIETTIGLSEVEVCLSVPLSVHPCPSVCSSVCPSFLIRPSLLCVSLLSSVFSLSSICLSSACLSLLSFQSSCPSVHLSPSSICLSVCLPACLPACLSVCLSVCLSKIIWCCRLDS